MGAREVDGFGRVTKQTVGGRVATATYNPSSGSLTAPLQVRTPYSTLVQFQYEAALGGRISTKSLIDGNEATDTAKFSYSKTTDHTQIGRLLTASSTVDGLTNTITNTYDVAGRLLTESFEDKSKASHTYTVAGKAWSYTDITGETLAVMESDTYGRPKTVGDAHVQLDLSYDALGRKYSWTTTDRILGNTLTTSLTWDGVDREYIRQTDSSAADQTMLVQLDYFENNQVKTRTLKRKPDSLQKVTPAFSSDKKAIPEISDDLTIIDPYTSTVDSEKGTPNVDFVDTFRNGDTITLIPSVEGIETNAEQSLDSDPVKAIILNAGDDGAPEAQANGVDYVTDTQVKAVRDYAFSATQPIALSPGHSDIEIAWANGTDRRSAYASLLPDSQTVTFTLPSDKSAKFVQTDGVIVCDQSTATAVNENGVTPDVHFVNDGSDWETVTLTASVDSNITASLDFDFLWSATLKAGEDDNPEAAANNADKHSVYATLSPGAAGKLVKLTLGDIERHAYFIPSPEIVKFTSQTVVTVQVNDDGNTPNVYFADGFSPGEPVLVTAYPPVGSNVPTLGFNFSPVMIHLGSGYDDNAKAKANASEYHSVCAIVVEPGQTVTFTLPRDKSATFKNLGTDNVTVVDDFTVTAIVPPCMRTPDVHFVDSLSIGETVTVTATIEDYPPVFMQFTFDPVTLTPGIFTVTRVEEYTYDARNRLVTYMVSNPTGLDLVKDEKGNAIISETFGSTGDPGYDAFNNILKVKTEFAGNRFDITTYTYDATDITQLTGLSHSNPSFGDPLIFQYDEYGCLLRDDETNSFAYDKGINCGYISEVRTASLPDALQTFEYDALGRLNRESGISLFYNGNILVNQKNDNKTARIIYGPSGAIVQVDSNNTVWLTAADLNGSILSADNPGNAVQRYEMTYGPYGQQTTQEGQSPVILGYNGERKSKLLEGYQLGNGYRLYKPSLRRFTSPDSMSPFGKGGINPYAYCEDDPLNNTDPTGHFGLFFLLNYIALDEAAIGAEAGVQAAAVRTAGGSARDAELELSDQFMTRSKVKKGEILFKGTSNRDTRLGVSAGGIDTESHPGEYSGSYFAYNSDISKGYMAKEPDGAIDGDLGYIHKYEVNEDINKINNNKESHGDPEIPQEEKAKSVKKYLKSAEYMSDFDDNGLLTKQLFEKGFAYEGPLHKNEVDRELILGPEHLKKLVYVDSRVFKYYDQGAIIEWKLIKDW